jgi:hypothetical protein
MQPYVLRESSGVAASGGGSSDTGSSSDEAATRDGPPYTWGQLARKPVIVAAGVVWFGLFCLMVTVLALGFDTAAHCVWLNGVCYDRPEL